VFAAHLRDRRETGQTIGFDAAVRRQTRLRPVRQFLFAEPGHPIHAHGKRMALPFAAIALQNIALLELAVPFMATLRAAKTLLPPLLLQRRPALFLTTVCARNAGRLRPA
jgi:hypothetical protein